MIVVIPCFNEPDALRSLQSLNQCMPTTYPVEVLLIINEASDCNDEISEQNQLTFETSSKWAQDKNNSHRKFLIYYEKDLPTKKAGVGLARKIGMDEAVRRLETAGNKDGIIICFDADTICEINYLATIESYFLNHQNLDAVAIHFEHPVSGSLSKAHYDGIVLYELFLRYYINALRWAGFPFAYHAIGSSMAVTRSTYQKVGGMNKRKAGEDFYFLHKIIPFGHVHELSSTTLFPSPRDSSRVPFGTGKAIQKWLASDQEYFSAYAPETFIALKAFLDQTRIFQGESIPTILGYCSNCPDVMQAFLKQEGFENQLYEIIRDAGKKPFNFFKRFFGWFNAFLVLKYCHFSRDYFHPNIQLNHATKWLLASATGNTLQSCAPHRKQVSGDSALMMLQHMRIIDRVPWKGGLERFVQTEVGSGYWPDI